MLGFQPDVIAQKEMDQVKLAANKRSAEEKLKRFIESNAHRIAYDVVDAPTFLASHAPELTAAQDNWPKIRFHALREHAGLVFETA